MAALIKLKNRFALIFLVGTMVGFSSGVANSSTTVFSATIAYEGACDISTPATVTFNNGESVLPSQIEAGNQIAAQNFDLTLANCKGIGVTPKITLTGESNTDTGVTLFLDGATSTSKGYGILLSTNGNSNFKANANLAKVKTISAIDSWSTTTSLKSINGTIPMVATLSCGNCATDGRSGGELISNVTFNFEYE